MTALLRLVWSICTLKRSPADMPYSAVLTVLLLTTYVFMRWHILVAAGAEKTDAGHALLVTLVSVTTIAVFTYLVLALRGGRERFLQTMAAVVATHIVIYAFIYPAYIGFYVLAMLVPGISQSQGLLLLFLIGIMTLNIWVITVTAHIYRCAMNFSFLEGLLVTLALLAANALITSQVIA